MQVAGGVWFRDNQPTDLLAFSLVSAHISRMIWTFAIYSVVLKQVLAKRTRNQLYQLCSSERTRSLDPHQLRKMIKMHPCSSCCFLIPSCRKLRKMSLWSLKNDPPQQMLLRCNNRFFRKNIAHSTSSPKENRWHMQNIAKYQQIY